MGRLTMVATLAAALANLAPAHQALLLEHVDDTGSADDRELDEG